jgi:transposase
MDVLYPRCAALDVHKRTVVAGRRIRLEGAPEQSEQYEGRTFQTMTTDILAMVDWLHEAGVTHVAMESTGEYWKPVYNLLEGEFELLVVNAHHVKNVPGRKTDAKDAEWLSDLLQHGLLSASFIPPPEQRDLRELVRHRSSFVRERVNITNRIQGLLENANIKLASVATDVLGKSGRDMLDRIVAGEEDAVALAGLARGTLRKKTDQLEQALTGRVKPHQRVILHELLRQIDSLNASIVEIEAQIAQYCLPFEEAVRRADTITGISERTAQAIISEIGADMSRFPSSGHLSAWAGVAPGNNESAGKRLSGRTRQGNKSLKRVLTEAAWAASRTRDTYLSALYRRIAARRGKKRAIMAVARTILVALYHMLKRGEDYKELGGNYFDERNKTSRVKHYTKRLEQLGYEVRLTQHALAA